MDQVEALGLGSDVISDLGEGNFGEMHGVETGLQGVKIRQQE